MNPDVEPQLVRALGECRPSEAIEVLSALTISGRPHVWKLALDALVTIGGPDARRAVQQARQSAAEERQSWIDEAIEQID